MGRRGPPKTPTAIKEQRGTDQPCRMNPDEPRPDLGIPAPPDWLGASQLPHYHEAGAQIAALGNVAAMSDADGIAMIALHRWRVAEALAGVEEHGSVAEDHKGIMRRTGWAVELQSAASDLARAEKEFGLTPASRPNVSASKGAASAPAADPKREKSRQKFRVV